MIKFFRFILFSLILSMSFAGCSKINITNNSTSKVQDKSEIKTSEGNITVVSLNEIPSIKEGTRVEISWAFPYVRYDGQVYKIVLDKAIEKDNVGRQIGGVERFFPSSMVISEKPFTDKDGDSNYAFYGSLIYESTGKGVKEAIIIDDKGVFREAVPLN